MGKYVTLSGSVVAGGLPAGYAAGQSVGANTITVTLPAGVVARGRLIDCTLGVTPASGNFVSTGATFNVLVWRDGDQPAAVADVAAIAMTPALYASLIGKFSFTGTSALGPTGTTVAATSQAQHMLPDVHGVAGAPFDFADKALAITAQATCSVQIQATGTWDPGGVATIAQTVSAVLTFDLEDH